MGKLSLSIGLSLAVGVAVTVGFSTSARAETAKVTASVLRMRSGPSTRYRTTGRFLKGTEVTIISKARSPWWKVRVGDRVGYMHNHYLHVMQVRGIAGALEGEPANTGNTTNTSSTTDTANTDSKTETARVDARRLRLRQGPSSRTRTLASLPRGSKVDVLDKSNGNWWKVRTPEGKVGYMFKDYLGSPREVIADPVTERADDAASAAINRPGDPVVVLGRHARVSARAIRVLKDIMREAGVPRAVITSGRRSPTDQARAMYQLLRSHGSAYGHRLYGWGGDQVIRSYDIARRAGYSAAAIQRAMVRTINRVGPTRVSNHCRATGDVFDVAPSSISRRSAFVRALRSARSRGIVKHMILPPSDASYHIELD